jgi:imidazolonepropionase-like amidohydrolase
VPVAGQTTAVRFARVVTPDAVLTDAMVLVEGDRILAVRTGAPPTGAAVIDLRRYTGLPGLIDAHVHATYYWDQAPGTRPWQQLGSRPAATLLVLAQANLRKALEAGVTTARDLYATDRMGMYLRDLIAEGHVVGPRLVVAGCGLIKRPGATFCGAHGDGPDEVTRVANQQLDAGADLIKVFGSTGSGDDLSGTPTHSYEELLAAVQAAHARGKRVTVHS